MTVNELIEKLQALPPEERELPVVCRDWNGDWIKCESASVGAYLSTERRLEIE